VLVEELVEKVAVFPDDLEVTITGAPRLNVGLAEVGLGGKQSENVGVGGSNAFNDRISRPSKLLL
jgi:hypothetical protein